jgi:hypothetical protein
MRSNNKMPFWWQLKEFVPNALIGFCYVLGLSVFLNILFNTLGL